MSKLVIAIAIILMVILLSAQEIQHGVITINVEVPVRVFKGNRFLDHLTREDFEVYENGILQQLEAVYLIKKTDITREDTSLRPDESRKRFVPQVGRNFILAFEITDYFPRIKEALAYCFGSAKFGPLMIFLKRWIAYNKITQGEMHEYQEKAIA
jgi:hypothetical protein